MNETLRCPACNAMLSIVVPSSILRTETKWFLIAEIGPHDCPELQREAS